MVREGARAAWRWLAVLLLAVACLQAQAQAVELRDDRGQRVLLDAPPQRIVSVLPSLTEMVCALGACDRLVGVDRYSNHPPAVLKLPRVGGGLDPSIEAIVALRPDLVLLATSSVAADRLQALGIRVAALEPKNTRDVQRVLLALGSVLGVADAPQRWRTIDDAAQAVAQALPARARGLRVYFEVNNAPYAASEASFVGETLARLGARNIVPGTMGPFPKINPEFVVRADPDVIMVGDATFTGMAQRPGWSALRAIRQGRVCVFPTAESDTMVRAGPRMADAAAAMARCLERVAP
ncbi:MAG: ABC transporter substrate-binding protein [Rhodoferax sp.]|nr:ABC transporter substrate-binding protein [Rhodoferax sp.]